jgi:hypothetical protein
MSTEPSWSCQTWSFSVLLLWDKITSNVQFPDILILYEVLKGDMLTKLSI